MRKRQCTLLTQAFVKTLAASGQRQYEYCSIYRSHRSFHSKHSKHWARCHTNCGLPLFIVRRKCRWWQTEHTFSKIVRVL